MAIGGLVGAISSFVLGYLLSIVSGFGFFLLWGGLLAGGAVGEAILRCTQRKRGIKMEALTAGSVALGVIASCMVWYFRVGQAEIDAGMTFEQLIAHHGFLIGALAIMLFGAISRVRFF